MLASTLTICLLAVASVFAQKIPECTLAKSVIVHFHGWKYSDIQSECEKSQSRYYCAFQISPPTEHQRLNVSLPSGGTNPWWQRHNTVSFSLTQTDSGFLSDLTQMITVCNSNSIRIYVDLEINNMGDQSLFGYGSAGGYYQGMPGSRSYPGFIDSDFHGADDDAECPTTSGNIEDNTNVQQVRFCNRRGTPRRPDTGVLNDLVTASDKVRGLTLELMDDLIDMGVAGFRLAHSRFVAPADVQYLVNNVKDITFPGSELDTRPFIYQDVFPDDIIPVSEYNGWGRIEEINAGILLNDILRNADSEYVMANLSMWGPAMGLMDSPDAVVFIDDPALQRGWLADWSDQTLEFNQVLSYRDPKHYQMATAFILSFPYGYPRIHSSYDWNRVVIDGQDINEYQGPPRTADGIVADVNVSTDGHSCTNGWNCEHRYKPILGMTSFHNFAQSQDLTTVANFWTNGRNQTAFSRATADGTDRAFVAFNNEESADLDAWIYSGMSAGTYCDVVTSDQFINTCPTGKSVQVDANGRVHVVIPANDAVGVIAILDSPV